MLQFMSGYVWKSLEQILCFNMYAFFFRQVDYAAECSDFKDHFIGNKTLCNGDFEQTG